MPSKTYFSSRSVLPWLTVKLTFLFVPAMAVLSSCGQADSERPPAENATTGREDASPASPRAATAAPASIPATPEADAASRSTGPMPNRNGLAGPEVPEPELLARVQKIVGEWRPQPIPAGESARTGKDYRTRLKEWPRMKMVEGYKKYGVRDPAWDEQVLDFLDHLATFNTDQRDIDEARRLLAQGEEIDSRLNCVDPMFLHSFALLQQWFDGTVPLMAARKLAWRTPNRFSRSRYPPLLSYRASLMDRGSVNGAVAQITFAAHDIDVVGDEHRMFLELLTSDLTGVLGDLREQLLTSLNLDPRADRWLVRLLQAQENVRLAWEARGHGYANNVPAEKWPIFHTHLRRARVQLLEAWSLRPEAPEAATELISVTMALGEGVAGEPPRFWFDQAVQAECDHLDAYSEFYQTLLPRWGGSHDALLAFARECLATNRFDTLIPLQYYDAVRRIHAELDNGRDVFALPGVHGDLKRLFDGYRDAAEDDDERRMYSSRLACLAWLAGDAQRATALLDDLGPGVVPFAFANFGTTLNSVRRSIQDPVQEAAWQGPFESGEILVGFDDSSGGGLQVACTRNGRIHLWWTKDGRAQQLFLDTGGNVVGAVATPDYATLAVSIVEDEAEPPRVFLFNIAHGAVRATLEPKQAGVIKIRFSPDGSILATAGSNNNVLLWDPKKGTRWKWGNVGEHSGAVSDMVFSPDGSLLATGSYDGTFKIWDLPQDREAASKPLISRATFAGFHDGFNSLSFAPDGQRLLVASFLKVELWNLVTMKKEFSIPGLKAVFSPDGKTFAASGMATEATEAGLYDADTGKEVQRFRGGHRDSIGRISFSRDGKTLFTFDRGSNLTAWDVQTGEEIPLPKIETDE